MLYTFFFFLPLYIFIYTPCREHGRCSAGRRRGRGRTASCRAAWAYPVQGAQRVKRSYVVFGVMVWSYNKLEELPMHLRGVCVSFDDSILIVIQCVYFAVVIFVTIKRHTHTRSMLHCLSLPWRGSQQRVVSGVMLFLSVTFQRSSLQDRSL